MTNINTTSFTGANNTTVPAFNPTSTAPAGYTHPTSVTPNTQIKMTLTLEERTTGNPKYVIPQLNKNYNHEDYPVGSEVVLRLAASRTAEAYHVKILETVFLINNYVTMDLEDDAYSQIELSWCPSIPGKPTTQFNIMKVMLQHIILLKDKQEYVQKDMEQRAIKYAMLEAGGINGPSFNTWEEWAELDVETTRKLALIKAGVHIENIHLYDELTVEELTSLKHHLRVLEK